MSRCSTPTSVTTMDSSVEDDALMRDCFELRRRLILTEKSLKSLNPQAKAKETENSKPERSKDFTSQAPLLTLDDLTLAPSDSETVKNDGPFSSINPYSQPEILERKSRESVRSNSNHAESRSITTNSMDLSNGDILTLRRKLLNVREENSKLFSQNNNLVTQLENVTYQLSDAQSKLRLKDNLLKEQSGERVLQSEHITYLEQDIMENELQLRNLMKNEELLNKRNASKDAEINKLKKTIADVEEDYAEELNIRKDLEMKLEESLHAGEQMKLKLMEIKDEMQHEFKSHNETERDLKQALRECERDKHTVEEKIVQLEEKLVKIETVFRNENEALKSALNSERGKTRELEENAKELEHDNETLKTLIADKQVRIDEYQNEVESAKKQLEYLETLVQQVQENAMKAQIENTPMNSDSGISNVSTRFTTMPTASPVRSNAGVTFDEHFDEDNALECSPGKSKAIVADLEMKLAKKDVEIHKLQAALTSRNAAQQRSFAGLEETSPGTMNGLRSELSAVVERSRMGDKKQQELEMMITRLQDDIARYSNQIMILEERLTDKMAHISSLEAKVSQKNLKMSALQNDFDRSAERMLEAESEIHKKDNRINSLENELQNSRVKISENSGKVKKFQSTMDEKIKAITELQGVIQMKESEKKQAMSLVDKVKSLHSEQCQEFENQIELFQQRLEAKALHIANLEAKYSANQQELDVKTSICEELQQELEKCRQDLEDRSQQLLQHEKKLQTLQEQLSEESTQVGNLEQSLTSCKNELDAILEKTEKFKDDSEAELQSKQLEYQRMAELLAKAKDELGKKTKELVNVNDKLKWSENRVVELREYHEQRDRDQRSHADQTALEKKRVEEDFNCLKDQLEKSSQTLEMQMKQISELETALKESHTEVKFTNEKLDELKRSLDDAVAASNQKSKRIDALKGEIQKCMARIDELVVNNRELEKKLADSELRSNDATTKADELNTELSAVHKELKQTVSDLSMLQKLLSDNQKEIQLKEEKVSHLDRMLNQSQEENQSKEIELQEKSRKLLIMDEVMKEHKLELKQKAVEVTQLDMTFKEQHSESMHKIFTLEHDLTRTVEELNQRTLENAEHRAKVDQLQEKIAGKTTEIENLTNVIKQQKTQLKEKQEKLAIFEQEIESFKSKEEEHLHTEQELRLARGNERQLNEELQVIRRELSKHERNEAELANELDDCHMLLKSKEADCTRLARDLGASQVREAQGEARSIQEIQKTTQQLQFKIKQSEREADKVQEKQNKKLVAQEQQLTQLKLSIQSLKDENRLMENDLQRSQHRVGEQEEDILSLSRQLQLQQQQAKELSENSLIKEAEITRLEARISGYERATFGFRPSRNSRPSTPVIQGSMRHNSPPPQRPASATPQLGRSMISGANDPKLSREALVPNLQSSWKQSQSATPNVSSPASKRDRDLDVLTLYSHVTTDLDDLLSSKSIERKLFEEREDKLNDSTQYASYNLP